MKDRRQFLKGAATVGGVATTGTFAGCLEGITGGDGNSGPTEDDPLSVAVYGGVFKDVLDEQLFAPFKEETGIPVQSEPQETSENALTQYQSAVRAGRAPVDVAITAVTGVLRGTRSDLWHTWDDGDIENIDNVADNLLHQSEDGLVGVGALSWYINLVHNTDEFEDGPTSWEALWDSSYEGQMGLLSYASNSFLLEIAAELHFGGQDILNSRDGILDVLEKLEEIKPQAQMWYENEAEFQQRLMDGEVPAGMLYNDVTLVMQDDDAPVESTFVEEGSVLDHGAWCTLKTSEKTDAAATFIDYASRPAVQDRISENLYTSPTVKRDLSELDDETYERIAGPGPEAAITPKYEMYLDDEEWINDRWNEFIIG